MKREIVDKIELNEGQSLVYDEIKNIDKMIKQKNSKHLVSHRQFMLLLMKTL